MTAAHEVVVQHQVAQARLAESATGLMLLEQGIRQEPDAPLVTAGFATSADSFADMAAETDADWAFARLVASLVQDSGRAAQGVAQASRADVGWTRVLTPPSCSRCAVLAGRVYRYNDGFLRHPGDDCTTVPVREGDTQFTPDPTDLARQGLIRGLSKADTQALHEGADLNQVVNARRKSAGLTESGRALVREGRPTPEGIYRIASDREQAVELLTRYRYLAP